MTPLETLPDALPLRRALRQVHYTRMQAAASPRWLYEAHERDWADAHVRAERAVTVALTRLEATT